MRIIDQSCAQMNVGVDICQPVFEMTLTVFDADTEGDTFTSAERRIAESVKTPYHCFMPGARIPL